MPSENGSSLVPAVPVGLGSKVGLGAGAVVTFIGAAFAFAHGDHSEETITALVVGGALILSVVWGRMLQAIAQIKAATPHVVLAHGVAGELPSGDAADDGEIRDEAGDVEDAAQLAPAVGIPADTGQDIAHVEGEAGAL